MAEARDNAEILPRWTAQPVREAAAET